MLRKCHIPNFFARRGISRDHLPDYVYDLAQQIIKRLKVARTSNTNEDTQLWKAQVTVFTPGNETTSDVFALVRRYNDGNWYLDRILSGPGIPLQ